MNEHDPRLDDAIEQGKIADGRARAMVRFARGHEGIAARVIWPDGDYAHAHLTDEDGDTLTTNDWAELRSWLGY